MTNIGSGATSQHHKPSSTLPCPVVNGSCVTYGWKRLFWRTVEEVGDPIFTGSGWLVPVLYASGDFGLLHYRYGDGAAFSFDELNDVAPATWTCRWNLRHSVVMPVIKTADRDVVTISVVQEMLMPEEDQEWYGDKKYRRVTCELMLYGILGPRNGRSDTIRMIPEVRTM